MAKSEIYRTEVELKRSLVLTVPGLGNSGPGHWQTRWEHCRDDCQRVDMGDWDKPHRNTWVNKLNLAILRADRPVARESAQESAQESARESARSSRSGTR